MSWLSNVILVLLLVMQQEIHALELFNPYKDNDSCTPSMPICSFELHATIAMTMFYKNLFRVVATDNGTLHRYDNPNQTFPMADIITGDGYPKLVRICWSLKNILFLLISNRFYVFNNSLPGPVLHVYQNQTVRIRIFNEFASESLSVHFHGIRQVNTPRSDGIGRFNTTINFTRFQFSTRIYCSRCGYFLVSFSMYIRKRQWDFMGAFIVHPRATSDREEQGEFVLLLNDWQHFYTSEQHYLLIESGQFYPNDLESLTRFRFNRLFPSRRWIEIR